jgi:bifunctional DNA-binding transcriptional regulator/antitoxin component of YhaV-PrlF toxin-antitoxin module
MSDDTNEHVVSVGEGGTTRIPEPYREELGVHELGRIKFVRTHEGEIVLRPLESATDLRGMLSDSSRGAVDASPDGAESAETDDELFEPIDEGEE